MTGSDIAWSDIVRETVVGSVCNFWSVLMYEDCLSERRVSINDICLDPNNPRFWSAKTGRDIPDRKIEHQDVQTSAMGRIAEHGITELRNSILRNGFLPLDRLVLRKLAEVPDKFVVVEGNRRLAALMLLRRQISEETIPEDEASPDYLARLLAATAELSVLIYEGTETDISWVFQGIRHISGIRNWEPAQRARLVADQIAHYGPKFHEVGQKFGLTAPAVGRLYRAYKALEQMREDDEFQNKAKNEYFTLFEEAIRKRHVKEWLEWDPNEYVCKNEDNVRQFYAWISPDDDHDKDRRIHDPRQMAKLDFLLEHDETDLLRQIDEHAITLDGAFERAKSKDEAADWHRALDRAIQLVGSIPQAAIEEHAGELLGKLGSLEVRVANLRKMAESVSAG